MMKRVTAVCLCLMMICSCALAQGSVNLGGEGCDQMKYVCTLPDGRLVFCGNGEPSAILMTAGHACCA